MGTSIEAAVAATRAIALPDLCSVEDLSRHLRRSASAIRTLLRTGDIPGKKIGRRWVIGRDHLLRVIADERGCAHLRALPKNGYS